jgi:hypothetical protein
VCSCRTASTRKFGIWVAFLREKITTSPPSLKDRLGPATSTESADAFRGILTRFRRAKGTAAALKHTARDHTRWSGQFPHATYSSSIGIKAALESGHD